MNVEQFEHSVECSAILNYINIILETLSALKVKYAIQWRDLDFNLYATEYIIIAKKKSIEIIWRNKQCTLHSVKFVRSKFKLGLLDRIYFKFIPRLSSSDSNRVYNTLNIIYDHFCRETGSIKARFADFKSLNDSVDFILALIYVRFFASIFSLEEFLTYYDPDNTKLTPKSVLRVNSFVTALLETLKEKLEETK